MHRNREEEPKKLEAKLVIVKQKIDKLVVSRINEYIQVSNLKEIYATLQLLNNFKYPLNGNVFIDCCGEDELIKLLDSYYYLTKATSSSIWDKIDSYKIINDMDSLKKEIEVIKPNTNMKIFYIKLFTRACESYWYDCMNWLIEDKLIDETGSCANCADNIFKHNSNYGDEDEDEEDEDEEEDKTMVDEDI